MTTIPVRVSSQIADLLSVAPVNVNAVADRLGLEIFEADLPPGISGQITCENGANSSGYVIYVDAAEALVRQRFTAAHEIGHFVLHREHIGDGVVDNHLYRSGLSNWMEAQANKFAADLLMPYPLVRTLIDSGVTSLSELARRLQVSEIAMGIRLGHPT